MFVIIHPNAVESAMRRAALQQSTGALVYRCDTAEWADGAIVMTNAVPELGNPREPVAMLVYVPSPGALIEVRTRG